ncbi:hypothetical protein [Streptomyces sp. st140]|uniref:hypothetical protein n=1 Tax=Streptomyces sp. st140 TaxID=1828052 RepID=UPI000BF14665|nr:hypothetical protein [Streptomyces sp. st140]
MDSTGTESSAGTGAEKDKVDVSLTKAIPAPAPDPAPTTAEAPDIQSHDTFVIRKTLSLTAGEYVVSVARPDGSEGEPVAYAREKRLSLRGQVTVYTDASRKSVLAAFKGRDHEVGYMYDVRDASGQSFGSFHEDAGASFLRRTWQVRQPGTMKLTGREHSRVVAFVRFVWEFVPYLEYVPFIWPYRFKYTESGKTLMTVTKKLGLHTRYVLEILAPDIDRRLAIAHTLALDALEVD